MPKQTKQISLDSEIVEQLKELNASKLVNDLLLDYFKKGNELEEQQIKLKIKEKQLLIDKEVSEINRLENKLKESREKEIVIQNTFKNIPSEILDDFKFFNKMDEEALSKRFNNIYRQKYKSLSYSELSQAWKIFNKGSEYKKEIRSPKGSF